MGANNLFDQVPPLVPNGANGKPINGGRVFGVPDGNAAWGQNGGYYYGRVSVNF